MNVQCLHVTRLFCHMHRMPLRLTDAGKAWASRLFCLRSLSTELGSDDRPVFTPRKAAVLTRITRYEFEKRRCSGLSETELKKYLESKNSDYQGLLDRHNTHLAGLEVIKKNLQGANIETRIVSRLQFDTELIDWADVIFTAGGDGTFLLAASKVNDKSKPVIGINTDPDRSEGHLCLPKTGYCGKNFHSALKRLLDGNFRWKWRHRIRITMSGCHNNDEAIELHDQQLQFVEHRFTEHIQENEQVRHPICSVRNIPAQRVLPVLALNEVFIAEKLSARVSYYELSVGKGISEKQKSSGVTVSTGTGSSSWFFHINYLPVEGVKEILDIANKYTEHKFPVDDSSLLEKIKDSFNYSLTFDPSEPRMAYSIRDPVVNDVFKTNNPRGFADKVVIRSRMWDACLVVDGGSSFQFNDGATATLEICDDDALRTVMFHVD
ncbi:NAD kinase 2, mitochondrial-like [Haliotis cracherodii]|uniref:NAD kinase 2, mitochondrial-like n=1 Tax=Haliotis cracherodii TaxID=6455 RepID=UPI0039E76031